MKGPATAKRITRRDIKVASLALVAALGFWLVSGALFQPQTGGFHEGVPIRGTLTVYKDGQVVYHAPDVVTYIMYGYVVCKLFNDSNACAQMVTDFTATGSNGCLTVYSPRGGTTTNNIFQSRSGCSAVGVGVSTSSSAPSAGGTTCSTFQSTNGFSPVKATTSFSTNTNTITLTASWTASGSVSNLQQVYLFPYDDYRSSVVDNSGTLTTCFALAADTFTAQSVSSGQSLSVQWTFTF